MLYQLEFEYDDGYGQSTPVLAQVKILGDQAVVLELECSDPEGGELSPHTMKCIDEMALEIAWRLHEQRDDRQE